MRKSVHHSERGRRVCATLAAVDPSFSDSDLALRYIMTGGKRSWRTRGKEGKD